MYEYSYTEAVSQATKGFVLYKRHLPTCPVAGRPSLQGRLPLIGPDSERDMEHPEDMAAGKRSRHPLEDST